MDNQEHPAAILEFVTFDAYHFGRINI